MYLFALIIALGVLHAFVLLPVLLVVVAPPACGTHAEVAHPTLEMSDATGGNFNGAGPKEEAPAGQI